MAKYRLYKNNNLRSNCYGKWYARKAAEGLVTTEDLVQIIAGNYSGFSEGQIAGVVKDLVTRIRALAYEGKAVKIDNLGIFRVSMKSKGVEDPKKFNAATDITTKWHVQPTGMVLIKSITHNRAAGIAINWEEDNDYVSPRKNQEEEPANP